MSGQAGGMTAERIADLRKLAGMASCAPGTAWGTTVECLDEIERQAAEIARLRGWLEVVRDRRVAYDQPIGTMSLARRALAGEAVPE